jgi:hypothetical protein
MFSRNSSRLVTTLFSRPKINSTPVVYHQCQLVSKTHSPAEEFRQGNSSPVATQHIPNSGFWNKPWNEWTVEDEEASRRYSVY